MHLVIEHVRLANGAEWRPGAKHWLLVGKSQGV